MANNDVYYSHDSIIVIMSLIIHCSQFSNYKLLTRVSQSKQKVLATLFSDFEQL